jgi:MFS family permease
MRRSRSQHSLARFLGLTTEPTLSGWANSCALLGCLVGSLLAGALSDQFGRKKLLILSGFLFAVISSLDCLFPSDLHLSDFGAQYRHRKYLLDLCRHLRRRIRDYSAMDA